MLSLAVGLPLVPPLLLRGALLRWLVARETASLCGAIRVEGGGLGWLVVPDLLLGRPFAVELRGLRVAGPDGGEVLSAEDISAEIDVARNPWRIVVAPALVSHGRWRLSVDGTDAGFLGAFRAVPAGATRAACLAPAPRRGGPRPLPSTGASLVVRDARLEEIDVELDFPVWGLALPRVRATGSLAVGTPGGVGFTFDVRDATAPGGRLRAGPGGAHATVATTTALFDDVVISHVGVSPDEPSDLVLAVAHADTGRSRLAGTAAFENVFARHGRRGERNPPGLALDARWERLTDAAARLEAPWLPREALGEILDGTMTARVRGPFLALTGALSIEGPRAGIEATVERGERATLDVRASGLALAPFLADSLEPLLDGRVTGRLRAALELRAGLAAVDLEIPAADITLARAGEAPEPRRLAFRVGPPAPGARAARADDDTLELGLTSARLLQRTLRLEGLSARWGDLSARGALALSLPPRAEGAPAPPGRVDASVTLAVASLARWVPPATASGQLAARVTVSGPLDHLRARLSFAPSTTATILGERFRAPAPVTATLDDGRALTLARLVLTRVGGGKLEARGRAERAGQLSGELRLTAYPLGALPGLTTVALPAALGAGHATSLGDALGGTLDAAVTVTGSSSRPAFAGTLALAGASLSGRRLGDGHFKARARGWTLALEGTLGPALTLEVGATRRPDGVTADGNLALAGFALGPWLPPALADLDVAISGHARVAVTPHRPLRTHLDVRAVGAGGDLALRGSTSGDEAEAAARGRVELGGLHALWGNVLAAADGAVDVDLATAPRAPLAGTIVVARALALRPKGWPLALGVAEGSRLAVDGTHVHVPGLALTAPGARVALAGDVNVDLAAPERSDLALTATARLDAGAIARQARLPWLSSAAGTIAVDARATGPARAPVATGAARLDALELRPRSATWPALKLDGLVEASGHDLLTRALRVEAMGDAVAQGAVVLGAADAPAVLDIASAWPLRVGAVDVPLSAHGLRVGNARSAFTIGALDLRLRLTGDPARELVLAGDVGVSRARVDPFVHKKTASGPARPWFEALPPRLTLDLTVHGPADALVVAVPVLPDVDLGFHCRVSGNARAGSISGQLRGRGLYSRLLLALFGPAGARQCRVLKE
ncbi:MAG TPA: hypothetical protein VGK52_13960 [Polyangia bacterium]